MARICNQCNSPIEEGGNFCTECGSNDIRDDSIETQANVQTDQPIPEMNTGSVVSFGDRSIENLQKANIQSIPTETSDINNQPNGFENGMVADQISQTIIEPKELQNTQTNSFADIPDFMNGTEEAMVPQTQQTSMQTAMSPNIRKNRKKKNTLTIVIVTIVVIVTIILIVWALYSYTNGELNQHLTPFHSANEIEIVIDPRSAVDYSEIYTTDNSYRVGNDDVGYVSIPKDWSKVIRKDKNTDILQYTDNTSWIVTLMSAPSSKYPAINYANSVYYSVESNGGKEIKAQKTRVNGHTAYTVKAVYPSLYKYLTTWCFESDDGKTHYLAIEGPEEDNDYFQIIYSFKENQ